MVSWNAGIQVYLNKNGRIDNIFTDAFYEKFTECLDEILKRADSPALIDRLGQFQIYSAELFHLCHGGYGKV